METERVFDGLDLSQDEVKRLGNALKDENFRKMLIEYAEEISDPENKRKAEEEIAMMEQERGMNVQFIHPEPGYVLKTAVDGTVKAFINICQNDKIDKPKAKRQLGPDGKSGLMWQIPHSFSPPKDDYDKSNKQCKVFDVVFHPDTYRMAMKNERFCKLVEDTAIDGIENQFGVKLDRQNIKRPKLKFKGTPTATVIRERIPDAEKKPADPDNVLNQCPYPYDDKSSSEKAKENKLTNGQSAEKKIAESVKESSKFTEPKYTITHRSQVDMSEYRNSPDAKTSTRPTELSVKIELPLLKSAAQANLEIYEKHLMLESVAPAAYKLDLKLPFPVDEDKGSAKFDKSRKTLTITLPVIPLETPPIPFATNMDSKTTDEINGQDVNSNHAPLIEVLDEKLNDNAEQINSTPGHLDNSNRKSCKDSGQVKTKPKFPDNVKWQLPDYQFSQDNETLTFILKVHNAESSSVDVHFSSSPSAVNLRFLSVGAGLFPVYYSLHLEFACGCHISADNSTVDVSNENLVFLFLKNKSSRGMWNNFKAGMDPDCLKDKQFLTETNLQQELSRISKESEMPLQAEPTPELSVIEMNEKKLTIDIKPPKSKKNKRKSRKDSASSQEDEGEEEYDDSAPSSAEIQVIHKHPTPKNLHSILKQRTVSESSEDLSHGYVDLPDSPRSEGEEQLSSSGGLRKHRSVSFNSHVDHTSFKSSASVSSMTPALKSKRRRQRKREERLKRGARTNSEGGTSSSEECSSGKAGFSLSEGEEEDRTISGNKAGLSRSLSDPGAGANAPPFTLSPIADKREEEDEVEESCSTDGQSAPSDICQEQSKAISQPCTNRVLDFRTISSESKASTVPGDFQNAAEKDEGGYGDVPNSQNLVKGELKGKGKASGEGGSKVGDKNKRIVSEIKSKLASSNGKSKGGGDNGECGHDVDDSDDDDFVDAVSSITNDVTSMSCNDTSKIKEQNATGEVVDPDKNKEKADAVDTLLSWQEGTTGIEHRTECAFKFSNSVMFDLDVD
ncbi:protein kintoun [Elysia marginata]|uniref:Protein kintoun n=1 Tax=Elysia marginata TaxID=1093978 RepID=A0AAV4EB53_9GAST|nr:protein kintoun [Elysia marginata]